MKIGILGTGIVGRVISAKLIELQHDVIVGTRDIAETMARSAPDAYGNPPFRVWHQENPQVKLGTFAEATVHGDIIINATNGQATLSVLKLAGEDNLKGKILIDIANPLDFSQGMPPTLSVCNDDSLGEQIQREFPEVKVVKTLNTMNAMIMVSPALLADEHTVFVSGNDADAKARVKTLLKDGFGWKSVIDLGDISTARGTEMLLPIWIRLMGVLETPMFNFKIVK